LHASPRNRRSFGKPVKSNFKLRGSNIEAGHQGSLDSGGVGGPEV